MIVPDFISLETWKLLRIGLVILTIALRSLTFREELQFHFNESYFFVQKLMQDKDEKVFRYIKLRIAENFQATWYAVFQNMSNFILPILLILCYMNRIVAFSASDTKSLALDFSAINEKMHQSGGKYDLMADTESLSSAF